MLVRSSLSAACIVALVPSALAQVCAYDWRPEIGQPGLDWSNVTYDAVRWDPDGAGPQHEAIVVAGSFGQAGGAPAISIAAWDPSTDAWSELGGGLRRNGGWADVRALAVLPDGSLVAGGLIDAAGTPPVSVHGIARFDGTNWSPLGQGVNGAIRDMIVLPNGHLVVAGLQVNHPGIGSGVLAWDGSGWYTLQSPLDYNGSELRHFEPTAEGGFLASGAFFAPSNPLLVGIARWSPGPSAQGTWSDVGGGLPGTVYGVNGAVELASGEVVACGDLRYDGGLIYYASKFDGNSWQRMDAGVDRRPTALALLPNGGLLMGTVWAGGISGGPCNSAGHLYGWTGSAWEIEAWVCQTGVGFVELLSDGDVVIGGQYSHFAHYLFDPQGNVIDSTIHAVGKIMRLEPGSPSILSQPASLVGPPGGPHAFDVVAAGASAYRWQRRSSAGTWIDLADGTNADADSGLSLVASGSSTASLVVTDVDLAGGPNEIELRARVGDGCGIAYSDVAVLTIDESCTTVGYCVAAPNSSGQGCAIGRTGTTSVAANDLVLTASSSLPNVLGLFYYGSTQIQVPFGNGFRCVGGSIYRLSPAVHGDASGEVARALDLTAPPASAGPGQIQPGSTWRFQFWYRDPAGGGALFNLSGGLSATFCP